MSIRSTRNSVSLCETLLVTSVSLPLPQSLAGAVDGRKDLEMKARSKRPLSENHATAVFGLKNTQYDT